MPRETWSEILAYYNNYMSNLRPLLEQTKRFILDTKPEDLLKKEVVDEEIANEEKRSVHKVKAISEFLAMFRREVFGMISSYIEETKTSFDPADISDYILDFLEEAISTFKVLESITNPDQDNLDKTLLFQITNFIQERVFPLGNSLNEIFDKLIEQSVNYYEIQRHILRPTTYYREDPEESSIPGISPKVYKIINEITSLFNLDPNYIEMPEDQNTDIPVILKESVFESFIDQIANAEENAISRILERIEFRVIDELFIGPTKRFIEIVEKHNYISKKSLNEDRVRITPQFSNETLILMYLAKVSYRRGFLSKELINWISANVSYLIYYGILKMKLSNDNIFYPIFTDLKTEEKILPYLMKLVCFDNYLRMDRSQIKDSVQYRKEVFNFLGSKIEYIDKFTQDIAYFISDFLKQKK